MVLYDNRPFVIVSGTCFFSFLRQKCLRFCFHVLPCFAMDFVRILPHAAIFCQNVVGPWVEAWWSTVGWASCQSTLRIKSMGCPEKRDWEIPYDPLSMKVYSGETPWWNFQTRLVTRFRGFFTRFMMVLLDIKCHQHSGGIRPWPSHPSNRIPRFPHLEQNWPGAPPKGSGLNRIPSVNANTLIVWSRKFSKSPTKPWLFGDVYWGEGIMSNNCLT